MPRSQRTRSARAIANDAAIREAAISEVLRVGVDHVSLRDVGHQAGLTHGATYARYEDVDELLVDLWNSVLCQRAIDHVRALHERGGSARAPVRSARSSTSFATRPPADVASVQVLSTARRIPALQEEVEPFIHDFLERDSGRSYTRARPSRAASRSLP